MYVGETGVGKSTLIDSLFKNNFPGERNMSIYTPRALSLSVSLPPSLSVCLLPSLSLSVSPSLHPSSIIALNKSSNYVHCMYPLLRVLKALLECMYLYNPS